MTDSLASAAESGSHLASLVALRSILAGAIDACESNRDLASLSQRFADVSAAIDKLTAGGEAKGTPLDELKAKRAARATKAARPSRAKSARPQ